MTRLLLLLLAMILGYWLIRRVIRAFLRGLGLENENVRRGNRSPSRETYKDVQDAEFKDITNEKR